MSSTAEIKQQSARLRTENSNENVFSLETKFVASENVLLQEIDGHMVFLNLLDERYFGVDEIGGRMWHVLTSSESLGAAVNQLTDEFDAESAIIERDLISLSTEWLRHKLIQIGSK